MKPTALLALLFLLPWTGQLAAQDVTTRPVIAERAVPVQFIAPVAADGHAGVAFLRKPPGDGPFPAVILIHGGAPGWDEDMLRDFALHTHASRFLEQGYVVAAMTRRDLDLDRPYTEVQDPVLDARAVFDYLAAQPYVDEDSIVLRGTSVGGYLALALGISRDAAAIMVEEPFSFPFVGVNLRETADPEVDSRYIDQIKVPVLLIRGDQTPNINDFNREVFIPAMQAAGKNLTVITHPGEMHSFSFYDNAERTPHPAVSQAAFREIDAFFRQHVRTQPRPLDPALVRHEEVVVGN